MLETFNGPRNRVIFQGIYEQREIISRKAKMMLSNIDSTKNISRMILLSWRRVRSNGCMVYSSTMGDGGLQEDRKRKRSGNYDCSMKISRSGLTLKQVCFYSLSGP